MQRAKSFFLFLLLPLLFAGCDTSTVIVNNISEREANEIVVLLVSKGIAAEKIQAPTAAVGGTTTILWNISVPAGQITESLSVLNQAGLPRMKGTSLLDIFGNQGLVPSDRQDRIRYQEGLSEQLATTIRKMDGIIDANVQISFPQDEEDQTPLTASIYVKHRGILDNPNSLLVTKIRRLVASAVPGLTPENVSVVSDRALYADINIPTVEGRLEESKDLTSIWGVVMLKESAGHFRLVFYIFLFLLLLFVCALGWLVWKCFPVIQAQGWKSLIKPDPYKGKSPAEKPEETPLAPEEEKEEGEE